MECVQESRRTGLRFLQTHAESIEDVLGPESLIALGQTRKLREGMEGQFKQPVELFPA